MYQIKAIHVHRQCIVVTTPQTGIAGTCLATLGHACLGLPHHHLPLLGLLHSISHNFFSLNNIFKIERLLREHTRKCYSHIFKKKRVFGGNVEMQRLTP